MTDVSVSVIIATRDREALLAQTLEALIGQQWPRDRFEILVIDNGSSDRTRAVVQAAAGRPDGPPTRYLYVAEPGKSGAINQALPYATGELLAFTDDDVVTHPPGSNGSRARSQRPVQTSWPGGSCLDGRAHLLRGCHPTCTACSPFLTTVRLA